MPQALSSAFSTQALVFIWINQVLVLVLLLPKLLILPSLRDAFKTMSLAQEHTVSMLSVTPFLSSTAAGEEIYGIQWLFTSLCRYKSTTELTIHGGIEGQHINLISKQKKNMPHSPKDIGPGLICLLCECMFLYVSAKKCLYKKLQVSSSPLQIITEISHQAYF